MKCPNCHSEIEASWKFCQKCGCPLQQGEKITEEKIQEKKTSKKSRFWIVAAVSILLCAALGAGFGWWYARRDRGSIEALEAVLDAEEETENAGQEEEKSGQEKDAGESSGDSQNSGDSLSGGDSRGTDSTESREETGNEDYILPDSSTRLLTEADLAGLSKEELRLARNEIYARHGRRFDDAGLQSYFDGKSWYSGTIDPEDFSESLMTETEKSNLELIQQYEQR